MTEHLSRNARAVVTGAGSGIGRAFALELAARGGRVVCADIDEAGAAATAERITAKGGLALAVACDVSRLEQVEALAEQAAEWFGEEPDLVINNAGVGAGGKRIGEISMDDWHWVMGVNMWGVIHGCHVFAPRLRRLPQAGIINVCSTASFAAAPSMGPYNASKAAVLAVSETLAAESTGSGLKVTALCPTVVKTNIFASGRIDDSVTPLMNRWVSLTGVSAEGVARTTLKALDKGRLYVLPQIDARLIWRAKRYVPALYARGAGLLSRFTLAS
ncbi:SDR family NAD(P)-dependent oxidoreductase [Alloalcanivorax gelatiniphagus]|uniref:SDR family NAD(P)-dependent oxidoreductase n=1 Tax=Alloalcanivorax gelatiniphagus TaxID=1194167 RepID=A0ABY2XL97_9GAMM|nr:SDR family NAD(P)-dependent oxidoreductase [Alloalcanivorax gelatiniphagus]TMW11994.1 SDR family NAD(P)-dependent oxidoreductase [Alloalcanivorax gelatiniphagus]